MAASVRIEDEAFSDRRYDVLAACLGLPDADCARGKMAAAWRQCTAQQTHTLRAELVVAILGPKGPDALVTSHLGEQVEGGIRIKGTKGRIEWLAKLRRNASKGGRSKSAKRKAKPSQEAEKSSAARVPDACPPAPTPVPVQAKPKTETLAAPPPVVRVRERDLLWDAIIQVTGVDPSLESKASHVGRVRKALAGADPPYGPADVLALPALLARQTPWASGRVITLGEIEKNIDLVRNKATPIPAASRSPPRSRDQEVLDELRDAQQRPAQ